VSGSGKSTLVQEVLAGSIRAQAPRGCTGVEWHQPVLDLLAQDQEAPAAGGQSTVATLAGVMDPLRKRFAASPEARGRKWTARHFSTAVPGGRCETCQGRGVVTVALDLLPDVTLGCEDCQGRRFQPEVLACRVGGLSIAEALDSTVQDLARRFQADRAIAPALQALAGIGLGYLTLGQEAGALSAGEAQRLRLAGLLAKAGASPAAVLLDEPTRGLGSGEVDRLLDALRRLARAGHLVVAVEHHLDFIAAADWIIDLGPEGGAGGGAVVVQGPPSAVAACAASFTGQALAAASIQE
jgi:excinuclease ABC subunit A